MMESGVRQLNFEDCAKNNIQEFKPLEINVQPRCQMQYARRVQILKMCM